jgi:hypothetical protein
VSKENALVNLLVDLFPTPESLRRFAYTIPTQSSEIPRALAGGSMEHLALSLVDELRRRGLADAPFFAGLEEARPDDAGRIRDVRNQWILDEESWSTPPRPDSAQPAPPGAPRTLVSYARKDRDFFDELAIHLELLRRKGIIGLWDEGRIRAGEAWDRFIESQIEEAEIFIPLVSADFLSSDFVWQHELPRAMERQRQGKAVILPVVVRPCLWEQSPIASLQVLPAGGKPISQSPNPDRTWVDVARRVEQAARDLRGE